MLSLAYAVPFLTGIWTTIHVLGATMDLSTVMAFDIGVYLVVVGALASVAPSTWIVVQIPVRNGTA